jgi:hypothetical protein
VLSQRWHWRCEVFLTRQTSWVIPEDRSVWELVDGRSLVWWVIENVVVDGR